MTKSQAIEKVRKLRRLAAQAGTREESSAAAGKAWDLAKEYGLTEDQITSPAPKTRKPKVVAIHPRGVHPDSTFVPIVQPDALLHLGRMAQELVDRLTTDALRRLGIPIDSRYGSSRRARGGRR